MDRKSIYIETPMRDEIKDEIIAEVWRNRDRLGEEYGHDLDALVSAMQERERRPLTRIVTKRSTRSDPPTATPRAPR